MATIYRNIQIKNKDIDLLKDLLIPYKNRFDDKYKILKKQVHSIAPMVYLNETEPIKILVSNDLDYMTLIAHNEIINRQLASDLSKSIDCLCIFAEFYDFEFYQISLYCRGEVLITLERRNKVGNQNNDGELNSKLRSDAIKMTEEQLSNLKKALDINDLFDSFLELENVFNAPLTIDFDHTDKKSMEEYDDLGGKWYFI